MVVRDSLQQCFNCNAGEVSRSSVGDVAV